MEFNLSGMPSYLLARCIQLGLSEVQIKQAANTPAFYKHDNYEYSLGVFLLLQAKMEPVLDEENYIWLQNKVFGYGYEPESWPDYKELVAVDSTQALELMALHMARSQYFAARKAEVSHKELIALVKKDKLVSLEGYTQLRRLHGISVSAIHGLVEGNVNLYYYAELLTKDYPLELFDRVVADFGTDLYIYLLAVNELGLEPDLVFERWHSEAGFDINKYKELRRRGLGDEKAWDVLRDPEVLKAMRI